MLDLNRVMVDSNKPDAQSMHGVDTEEHFPGLRNAMAKDSSKKEHGDTSKTTTAA